MTVLSKAFELLLFPIIICVLGKVSSKSSKVVQEYLS